MRITVIGTGYVGLVTGACLADLGNDVLCLDIDERKIARLREGIIPIHEPGLTDLVQRNTASNRLAFTTDASEAARHGTVQFIAVGTPPGEDGSADLQYVLAAARDVGRHMNGDRVVVDKSTVPVGTADRVRAAIQDELNRRDKPFKVAVVSNPEFLKEGAAVEDFMRPDRIVVGSDDEQATRVMRELYLPFERNHAKLMVMDTRSAELTKYAANAMLATRISFMNEMALLAEAVGADIDAVRRGIGADRRIGSHFLYAGCGYGGSCFPKDIAALSRSAREAGLAMNVLSAVEAANQRQKNILIEKIEARFGRDLSAKVFAVWGLAFKPGTDDMREAPSIKLIETLARRGATVRTYDPVAMDQAKNLFAGLHGISYWPSAKEAVLGADALVIVTEWKEFRSVDLKAVKSALRQPIIFDGRNILEPRVAQAAGFEYVGIGRAVGPSGHFH